MLLYRQHKADFEREHQTRFSGSGKSEAKKGKRKGKRGSEAKKEKGKGEGGSEAK